MTHRRRSQLSNPSVKVYLLCSLMMILAMNLFGKPFKVLQEMLPLGQGI
jgi:hypothetical protein